MQITRSPIFLTSFTVPARLYEILIMLLVWENHYGHECFEVLEYFYKAGLLLPSKQTSPPFLPLNLTNIFFLCSNFARHIMHLGKSQRACPLSCGDCLLGAIADISGSRYLYKICYLISSTNTFKAKIQLPLTWLWPSNCV